MPTRKPFSETTDRLSAVLMDAINSHPELVQFTTLDLVAAEPGLLALPHPGKDSAKSIAQGMNALKRRGKLHITERKRCNGESFTRPVFARGPGADFIAEEGEVDSAEQYAAVTRQTLPNGITRVRFGAAWKPQHREPRTIGMMGYSSALANANP